MESFAIQTHHSRLDSKSKPQRSSNSQVDGEGSENVTLKAKWGAARCSDSLENWLLWCLWNSFNHYLAQLSRRQTTPKVNTFTGVVTLWITLIWWLVRCPLQSCPHFVARVDGSSVTYTKRLHTGGVEQMGFWVLYLDELQYCSGHTWGFPAGWLTDGRGRVSTIILLPQSKSGWLDRKYQHVWYVSALPASNASKPVRMSKLGNERKPKKQCTKKFHHGSKKKCEVECRIMATRCTKLLLAEITEVYWPQLWSLNFELMVATAVNLLKSSSVQALSLAV